MPIMAWLLRGQVGNTFIVDLILTAPLENAVWSDDLSDTINYATVYETVKAEMAIPSRLLEHAAGRILKAERDFPECLRWNLSCLN